MKPRVLTIVLILFTFHLHAADYYWVGGGGNWSDLNHWRLGSSAGSIPSTVPSSLDNVFFGSYSGLGSSGTVTVNANAFCNNMTWESGVPSVTTFAGNGIFTVTISGNLVLAPTVTYSLIYVIFTGSSPATLTSNGTVTGTLNMIIDKPGSGLTLADNLIYNTPSNSRNIVELKTGYFNAPGKTITAYGFGSNEANSRSVDISNASIVVTGWGYSNINKTLNATGSYIKTSTISIDGGVYNVADVNATANENSAISNTTFKKITFTNPSLGSEARIGTNNTVDSVIFMGSGSVRSSNNTVGYVSIAGTGSVGGTSNQIHYADIKGAFSIIDAGNNVFDTLLTAPNKNVLISGTNTINQYFRAGGTPCDGFTEITGVSSGTLNFASGADFDIDNVLLTNLAATGTGTPITLNGIDNGGNTGFVINEPSSASGTTLYWVNGAGDWNDRNHWSYSSGGGGGACVPFVADNVVFDANSGFTAGNNTVTTSANTYCRDMTWAAGVGTAIFTESGSFVFRIYGSLVMQPAATLNAFMEFHGSDAASITTNGNTTGGVQFIIVKINDAVVTLSDNWNNPSGGSFVHRSGGLNLAGRSVDLVYFHSIIAGARSVDISNATLNFTRYWDYRAGGKSLAATGSHIITPEFNTDGLSYPLVDVNSFVTPYIVGTTFGQLTFTHTSATSAVGIGENNTIRRLEFKGKGLVNGGGNSFDTLILAGSRNYTFVGTNTINNYLQALSTPCAGLSEIKGSPSATLAFGSGAVADMSNIYMQNMTATGPITPIAFNGADAGGNSGWTINVASGSSRYWIGGSGDWNDAAHWSTTSGGSGGACIPTVYDDIFFDANSGFTAASKTVTVNNGNAYCRNIDWTGSLNSPVWSKSPSWTIEVWGDSVIVNPDATFTVSPITLKGANATFLKGNAPLGNFDVWIDKPGGSLTLLNDYINTQTDFTVVNGTFNAAARTLNVASIDNSGLSNTTSIDISNTTITTGLWRYTGVVTNHTLNAANSIITAPTFHAAGLTYNSVFVSGTAQASASISNTIIDSLTFTNTSTTSAAGINGASNTIGLVEYKGSGRIYSTGNTIDTLIFFPGNIYTLYAGTNTTITGEWYGSGTPCRLTEIVSSTTTGNATVTKTSGDVNFDYVRLRRITAAGVAAPFAAGSHSTDLGNNTNWNIEPYDGAAPIYGLGPDTSAYANEFPIVLHTDGFFGSPSSQYVWNDNSTADTLLVTEAGTYSVNVGFPDGCNISDEIVVNLNTLPITITNFTASVNNCKTFLAWKTADALQFSHFVVEQSKDGSNYTALGEMKYTEGIENYAFTDARPGNGTTWYRLKLVDIDKKFEYSAVVSVRSDCGSREIQVRPTITHNNVQVMLPDGFEKAKLYIVNTWGQRIVPVVQGIGTVRTVNLEALPAATYMLQVVNGRDIKTYKIVKL